jgi:hypothetical protein
VKRLVQENRKTLTSRKFPVKSFQSSDRKINILFTENIQKLETVEEENGQMAFIRRQSETSRC